MASALSSLRKNKGRACDGIDTCREKKDSKYDMLLRDAALSNENAREYVASETGSKYDGDPET